MDHLKSQQLNKARNGMYYSDYPEEYSVSFFPNKGGTYVIEINDEIAHVSQFQTAVQVLNMAKPEDEIEIRLSCCPGGSVDAGDTMLHAMRRTEAHIKIIASGGTHSMATQLLIEADEFELSNGFNACIHAGYNGSSGTVAEYNTKSKFDFEFRTQQFKESYEGFLTPQEIDEVLAGRDIWLTAQNWCDRAMARMEYFQNKWETIEKEAIAAAKPKRAKNPQTKKTVVDNSDKPVVE